MKSFFETEEYVYVIEKIGKIYIIRKEYTNGWGSAAIDGKRYKSETAAREAAKEKGIEIKAIGGRWEIVAQLDSGTVRKIVRKKINN